MGGHNYLVTGLPGCGKTTLIQGILQDLGIPATGFFTEEVREGQGRVGFRLRTLEGKAGWLAHIKIRGPHRVGRYGVSLQALEEMGIASLRPKPPQRLIVVDEIGKMECLSPAFRKALLEALDGTHPVLGTIAQKGGGWLAEVRGRPDVRLFRLDPSNRDLLRVRVLECIRQEMGLTREAEQGG